MAEKAKTTQRPVNLSLSEALVAEVRGVTDNLSETVETLLTEFVSKERARRVSHAKAVQETIATGNAFAEKHGSFAEEHSTL